MIQVWGIVPLQRKKQEVFFESWRIKFPTRLYKENISGGYYSTALHLCL